MEGCGVIGGASLGIFNPVFISTEYDSMHEVSHIHQIDILG